MRFNTIHLAILAAVPVFASPFSSTGTSTTKPSTNVLVARAPQATQCGTFTYADTDIISAFNAGQAETSAGTTIKALNKRKYPARFNNFEGIDLPDCRNLSPPFIEFPVLRTGATFTTGSDQGPDRVIYAQTPTGIQFCGVDTHEGAVGNAVLACSAVPPPPPGPSVAPAVLPETS